MAIPGRIPDNLQLRTSAKYVLIIEKDAIFKRLLEEGFHKKYLPCILITGGGMPDLATRMLLHKIWSSCQQQLLEILSLFDYGPYGFRILFCYKFGSIHDGINSSAFAINSIKWLGLHSKDVVINQQEENENELLTTNDRIETVGKPLTCMDRQSLDALLKEPLLLLHGKYQEELFKMKDFNRKLELESLGSNLSTFVFKKIIQMQYI